MDESELLRELSRRLDHIEDYLGHLGRVSGFPYRPYQASDPGLGSFGPAPAAFGSAPASFGPAVGFNDVAQSPSPVVQGPGSRVPAELVALAQSGQMIQAIQQYRQMSGLVRRRSRRADCGRVRWLG